MSFDTHAFLADLRYEVESHTAVNHTFLARVATNPFTREDYRIFGLQHYPLVGMFTTYLERLLLNGPDSQSKTWLAKVLVDEYGEGSDGEDHATLYRHYLTACGVGPGEENSVPLDPRVTGFVRKHLHICTHEPFLVGLGAIGPGHEWAIPIMFTYIIEGLSRAGFTDAEINYFTLHCLQDIDHANWLQEALADLVTNEEEAAQVRKGALLSLQARAEFWEGVQSRVVRWRQPARPWDFREKLRIRLGRHQPQLAKVIPSVGNRIAVYRPHVRAFSKTIPM
jgi:pyrroloquinoline quinone (PQQ) biosynthesis protein C